MRNLQSSDGSFGYGETSGEDGDTESSSSSKDYNKNLILKANTVPLIKIFKHYGIRLDDNSRKIICPFPSHKGGREMTPSFYYYANTNTFWCFGCKVGVYGCDFVSAMDNINKYYAANKILDLFNDDSDDDNILDKENFSEKLEIMMSFSNFIRKFIENNSDDKSIDFIERICRVYDSMNLKHNLSNEALLAMINQLKDTIVNYK